MQAEAKDQSAEMMSAYLDHELDEGEAAAFEAFLADSPEAQQEMSEMRMMLAAVSQLGTIAAPEDFYEKLDRKIRRRKLLSAEGLASSVVSVPFQVLSILVILAIAVSYMMLQLDDAARIEKEHADEGGAAEQVDTTSSDAVEAPDERK